jgi:putative acetyltransferase
VSEPLSIRREQPADHAAIDGVVRAAFAGHPDEVALLVERIRDSPGYVPELALVAEDTSGVIGHVLLSFVPIEGGSRTELLILTPMSVRPDRQRAGVGSRLIGDVLARAASAGEPAVLVEGIPAYYPRFGFERASPLGFVAPHDSIPDDAFMVKRLPGFESALAGHVMYPQAFDHLAY